MTAVDLPAIRALLEGVTPGPWQVERVTEGRFAGLESRVYSFRGSHILLSATDGEAGQAKNNDAAFIAAAPSIVAQLLGVVDEQQAKLDAVTKIIDEKYHLWAAICGETCVKDVLGIDHDAIAEAIANRIRAAITGEGQ